jgi:hypothetical protein
VQGSSNLRPGFELGAADSEGDFYIFNHLAFNVLVHMTHGEFTRAQNHSPYTNGLVMDAATRKLLRSRNIAEDSLVTGRDEASGRLLAWPEGTPDEVVSALHGMSGRALAADKKTDKEKQEEEKKEREMEKEEEKKEKEEEVAAVCFRYLPCMNLLHTQQHLSTTKQQFSTSELALIQHAFSKAFAEVESSHVFMIWRSSLQHPPVCSLKERSLKVDEGSHIEAVRTLSRQSFTSGQGCCG